MGNAISKAEGIGFCVCFALILISIVLGNLLTIILFVAKKRLRKPEKSVSGRQYGVC